MRHHPDNTDKELERIIQALLPCAEKMAKKCEVLRRARKVRNITGLLRIVFLYCGLDKPVRTVASIFTLLYERITDTAIRKRLLACKNWLRAILVEELDTGRISEKLGEFRFLVIDGTCVQGPGSTGTDYRLHVAVELETLSVTEIKVTDRKTGESLRNFSFGPGDVVIGDRAYSQVGAMRAIHDQGVRMVIRLNTGAVRPYDSEGNPVDLVDRLKGQAECSTRTLKETVGGTPETRLEGYIHAYRLTEAQGAENRRKIRTRAAKKGVTVKKETLFFADFVIIFTTLSPVLLQGTEISDLYRLRWQVELLFKRWKSILDVDKLRCRLGSHLADVWLYGKLLYVLMTDRRARRTFGDAMAGLDEQRAATLWRPWQLTKEEIDIIIGATDCRSRTRRDDALEVLRERPRKRRLQRIPTGAVWLARTINSLAEEQKRNHP